MTLDSVGTYDSHEWGGGSTVGAAQKRRRWTVPFMAVKSPSSVNIAVDPPEVNWAEDVAALPGEAATVFVLENVRARRRLSRLIKVLCSDENVYPADDPAAAQRAQETALASLRLLNALPRGSRLPKVSPDGEGGLHFLWSNEQALIVTVDGWRLHIVEAPGTPDAVYRDDVDFAGRVVPQEILAAIRG